MQDKKDQANLTRRDVVKTAAAVGVAAAAAVEFGKAPAIVKAAGDTIQYAVIGSGGRGSYLLKHLNKVENGK